jgi:DNA-directed RNA polymerase subunit beta
MPRRKKNNSTNPLRENRERRYFTSTIHTPPFLDLIEIQTTSYAWFFEKGLSELFDELSPIQDNYGKDLELYFDNFYLDEPKFNEVVSKSKNITFEAPLRVKTRLLNKRTNNSLSQEVYLGDFPLMTERGTFIINGSERVVVSQLIRSSGVFFTCDSMRGRRYYGAKIIPNRGAWLELETDQNNVIWVKIDRKRKVAATSFLRAIGFGTNEQILEKFASVDTDPDIKYIENTFRKDTSHNEDEGLIEVYKRMRPGDLATPDNAKQLIYATFFNFDRYDFGMVGRYKLNERFGFQLPINKETRVLQRDDFISILSEIISLNISQKDADDIDHLGNRRVRSIGELVQNKFRVGLARMERIVRDRMTTLDPVSMTPNKLINARPVIGAVKEFFMSCQLSQFMDQTNPLAELEHKRRLSATGPGGLSRERAGFEVRDVHRTHYGRICPIHTPEGQNIGLIGHLASYARVNHFGFIETPFRKVQREGDKSRVTDEIIYLNALAEEKAITTSATTPLNSDGTFKNEAAEVRKYGIPSETETKNIEYMDVASNQIISIATSLIPFVEHDDANRALMGTNMQKQAVPCIKPEAPIIGTGIESKAAYDSGHILFARDNGKIVEVDSQHISILYEDGVMKTYTLKKFLRSNTLTCINQTPRVDKGDIVKKGALLADGFAVDHGEIALGQNLLVAFMPWEGYNYEDAIIISERLVQNDRFTSIYIENYSIDIRDTKLGPETVTSDIPNISEEKLSNLDENGIVRIGARVKSGDILVGKITPKGETDLSAEEKLLRAIFGEKSRDVRDSSLYLEHGEEGTVIDVKIFSREEGDKLPSGVIKTMQVTLAHLRKIQVGDKLSGRHGNKGVISKIVPVADMPFLPDGIPIDIILSPLGVVSRMNLGQILETHLGLAAKKLGYRVATQPFNGVKEEQIKEELQAAGYPIDGKLALQDGRTGRKFDNKITVGIVYVLKLNHMVDDKIHQRSIGPYSLITQQPLGGKAQFGGQRFGEMEVWALEAYGAAYTLQEILTIKSDDVPGRSKAYESLIKGEEIHPLSLPESFNVLVKELKGLSLDVELLQRVSETETGTKERGKNRSTN